MSVYHGLFVALALAHAGAVGVVAAPNLIGNDWKTWAAHPNLTPEMEKAETPDGPSLRIRCPRFESYGKWTTSVPGIRSGRAYRFDVLYRSENVTHENVSVAAILTWQGAKGMLQRDYVDVVSDAGGGWRRLERVLQAPDGAAQVGVELALRWTAGGAVLWRSPRLTEAEAPAKRPVRIVTTRLKMPARPSMEANLAAMSAILDIAGAGKPDLVLMTEAPVDRGVRGPLDELSEPIPGPATRMISEKARRFGMYVAVSLHEKEGGTFYNTAVLIDRKGAVAGKYRKVHLATAEGERGITPGSDFPVFQTDFGKVGMMICWDNWFPESARALRLNGAELVLLPIAGDGVPGHWDVISRARAIDNSVYLVTSATGSIPSRIIDPNGQVLAETNEGIAAAEIDLAQQWRVRWLSVGPADGEAKSLYIKERRPDTYRVLLNGGSEE